MFKKTLKVFVSLTLAITLIFTVNVFALTKTGLISIIENVQSATGYRYNCLDSQNYGMDEAKIIEDSNGGYFAVYHSYINGIFYARLATSTDLLNWTFVRNIGSRMAMPAISLLTNNGYLVVCEESNTNGAVWLNFYYYANRTDLINGSYSRHYDAPMTLSSLAEGTPNIYSVVLKPDIDHSSIDIGFHYYMNGDVDRNARGTLTNFNSWGTFVESGINNAIIGQGCSGNIGDRDYVLLRAGGYNVIEGQRVKNDWSTWGVYLWDWQNNTAQKMNIQTHGGSTSIGNPSITDLKAPNDKRALVMGDFIFSEGSAIGEPGELIYYKEYGSVNLAKNKTCTASSQYSSSYVPNYAADGNENTRWASGTSGSNEWLRVDLGVSQTIDSVLIRWETAFATSYNIQVSTNGSTWTTVSSTTNAIGGTTKNYFSPVSARYVRVNCTGHNSGLTLYSIWSFEVYNGL